MENKHVPRGVIAMLDAWPGAQLTAFAQALEARGYDSFWLPELFGREPVASAAWLLAQTTRLIVATGIANVYARDAHALAQTRHTLAEFAPARFILGLGVSNPGINGARGHAWQPPLARLSACLDALDAVTVEARAPAHPAPLVLAAHGPRLQALAAARADGILTYLMSPAHTRRSRQAIGPAATLDVVVPLLAETDAERARRTVRGVLGYYLGLDYYHREWRKLGFTDADFSGGGSDALVDGLVAWGDRDALEARLAQHVEAGASRVIVMPLDLGAPGGASATLDAVAPRR
jgi:probable F420-dependent oxidoreductase